MPSAHAKICTEEDYYNLPENVRAELIEGNLIYNHAVPSRIHQSILMELSGTIRDYLKSKNRPCRVYPAPFAVKLREDRKTIVEPDISVICDRNKLTDRGCTGAPDWIIEIVSPGSKPMDYFTKLFKYRNADVREYWIVDPTKDLVMAYRFEKETMEQYSFGEDVPVGIYEGFSIKVQ